ncbi:hypothetical protein V8C37DRAFT_250591 [Trichoderma ceciliae]
MFPIACGPCLDLVGSCPDQYIVWLGWEQMQPNFDAQTNTSLSLTASLVFLHRLFPASNFRTPTARMTAITALSVGLPLGNNQRSPTKTCPTPRSCVLRSNVLQGDEIHESTLLFPPPKSRLESITRVMKQPREFATLVQSFAVSHRLVAAFRSCRLEAVPKLAPLALIRASRPTEGSRRRSWSPARAPPA